MSNIGIVCDNCGKWVQGITWVNGMKFCAKCYQETFGTNTKEITYVYVGNLKEHIKVIEEKDKQITDLEAKLAESEKKYKKAYQEGLLQKQFDKDMEIAQLKQQLAEKDKKIEYYKKQAKKFNNEAQKYYEDAYCNDFHNQDKISFALEQLEKVKELAHNHIKEIANDLSEEDDERLNQKHTIHGLATVITYIDNQIKQLKEQQK